MQYLTVLKYHVRCGRLDQLCKCLKGVTSARSCIESGRSPGTGALTKTACWAANRKARDSSPANSGLPQWDGLEGQRHDKVRNTSGRFDKEFILGYSLTPAPGTISSYTTQESYHDRYLTLG
jgi:hypothetical protein